MLKIIFSISVFLISSYIGFAYADTYRKRLEELKEILKALIILENEVVYGTTPLPEALSNLSYKVSEPIKVFVIAIKEKLIEGKAESVYKCVLEEFEKVKDKFNIYDEDKKVMLDFFHSLGEAEVYGQEKIFSLAIEGIKFNLKDAEENAKKNIKLYRYLGMCFGAMIIVFII